MSLDILAVGTHPDDAEIWCGGLLLKWKALSYRTGSVHLTVGEMGSGGTPEVRRPQVQLCTPSSVQLSLITAFIDNKLRWERVGAQQHPRRPALFRHPSHARLWLSNSTIRASVSRAPSVASYVWPLVGIVSAKRLHGCERFHLQHLIAFPGTWRVECPPDVRERRRRS
jgi:hypothetical protein